MLLGTVLLWALNSTVTRYVLTHGFHPLAYATIGFVASGSGGFSGHVFGDALAVSTALTWGMYSVAITPLMRRYSPFRISALVLALGWVPIAAVGLPQTASQTFHFGTLTWLGFGFAVIG